MELPGKTRCLLETNSEKEIALTPGSKWLKAKMTIRGRGLKERLCSLL